MADYSTTEARLQVVNLTDSEAVYVNQDTGAVVEALKDEKYPWKERKQGTLRLADAYKTGGVPKKAEKARTCSTWLEYLADKHLTKRQLLRFNACHLRLCPVCSTRKARIMAIRLAKVLEKVLTDHPKTQVIFLTLTVRNCTGDKLRDSLDALTRAWTKLTRRRGVDRAIKGWFRAIEITRNRSKDTYHPHIHAVLVVEDDYFQRTSGLYITHNTWVTMWRQSLQVDYDPTVYIERTTPKDGKVHGKSVAAAVEAAKYATKSKDYLDSGLPMAEAAKVVDVYTTALARKRMTAMGGWVLTASQELDLDVEADTDLVHDEDGAGELTLASAAWIEDYGWHFGVGDHLLTQRIENPNFVGGEGDT